VERASRSGAAVAVTAEIAGNTSLHDATLQALNLLESARNPRPVVLVITDGFDNASRFRLVDIVKTRRQSEALVYAFAVAPDPATTRVEQSRNDLGAITPPPSFISPIGQAAVNSVSALVGDSGGTSYTVINTGSARASAHRFVDELRWQYTLGYTPAKPLDGKYRRVKVELKKRGYQIRHRGGYLAMPLHQ
jgi:VWFA-related protein